MDAAERQAAEGMYRALRLMPCVCKTAGAWPFRKLVNGKPPADVACERCRAMAAWEAVQLEKIA